MSGSSRIKVSYKGDQRDSGHTCAQGKICARYDPLQNLNAPLDSTVEKNSCAKRVAFRVELLQKKGCCHKMNHNLTLN